MSVPVSVIIPTYNRAVLLEHLLQQLQAQMVRPVEVIVVNDHSTDTTAEVVRWAQHTMPMVRYVKNAGHHLAAARACGLQAATSEYVGFIDDDVVIDDPDFFSKLARRLAPDVLIQPKVIMENFGQQSYPETSWRDWWTGRPWPVLELRTTRLNVGGRVRPSFPFNELGVFWHRRLNRFWSDPNLRGDAYGQSYSTALQLLHAGCRILFYPELQLRHPGAERGGSKKFGKKKLTEDFTPWHYDYFYNMIYIHARWLPGWVGVWLPFYVLKSVVAVAMNHNVAGWKQYGLQPIYDSLRKNFLHREYQT